MSHLSVRSSTLYLGIEKLGAIVKVKIAEGTKRLGGRVLSVRTSLGSFQTPTRAPNASEAYSRTALGLDEPWENPIFEVVGRFNGSEDVARLHKKNGAYARVLRRLKKQIEPFSGYALTKYFPQFPSGTELTDRDIRVLVELQLEAGCDIVSVPEAGSVASLSGFSNNLKRYWEFIESTNPRAEVMPYLTVNQDPETFEKKLVFLQDFEHSLWAVGIVFGSPLEFRPNFLALAEFGDSDFLVHCSGGRRYPSYARPLGQLHALQRYRVDTVAAGTSWGGSSKSDDHDKKKKPPVPATSRVRYFDKRTIMYPAIGAVCPETEPLPCKCAVCRGRKLAEVLSEVDATGPKAELAARLNDVARVHEVFGSTAEFERTRTLIKEGALTEYFRGKIGLQPFVANEGRQRRLY